MVQHDLAHVPVFPPEETEDKVQGRVDGVADAGVADAGVADAGGTDAGPSDAPMADAGVTDGAAAPAPAGDAGVTAPTVEEGCPVQVMDRATFLRQPGTQPARPTPGQGAPFGLTDMTIAPAQAPDVRTVRRGGRLRVEPTTATMPPIRSIAVGAGTFREGDVVAVNLRTCPDRRYPVEWVITQAGARKIVQGEQEHCSDFRYAFDISWRAFAAAANAAATANETFPSETHARRTIGRRVGVHPDDWFAHFVCLSQQSETKRDLRPPFSHTPDTRRMLKRTPDQTNCTVMRYTVDASALPLVGQSSSAQVILPSECATPAAPSPRRRR